jgi:cytochrome P450
MFADLARAEIARWADGDEFAAIGRMQAITLEIILRVVFGVTDPERLAELRPLVTKIANLDLVMLLAWRYPRLQKLPPWRGHAAAQQELDDLLYAEIAARRGDPTTPERDDLLSRLLRPSADGDVLTDAELRDQLITFLLAGHETTATSLSWALHELAHRPDTMSRAQRAADNPSAESDQYLEAVVKEAMRLRPVIFQATRTLTEDTDVAGYRLSAGVVVSPALGLVGLSEALHDDAADFRPERFLGTNPAPNTWIPFRRRPATMHWSRLLAGRVRRDPPRAAECLRDRAGPEPSRTPAAPGHHQRTQQGQPDSRQEPCLLGSR